MKAGSLYTLLCSCQGKAGLCGHLVLASRALSVPLGWFTWPLPPESGEKVFLPGLELCSFRPIEQPLPTTPHSPGPMFVCVLLPHDCVNSSFLMLSEDPAGDWCLGVYWAHGTAADVLVCFTEDFISGIKVHMSFCALLLTRMEYCKMFHVTQFEKSHFLKVA